jgi:hypothetical protein
MAAPMDYLVTVNQPDTWQLRGRNRPGASAERRAAERDD